jgi:periplasmic divalent cation tolerance protein
MKMPYKVAPVGKIKSKPLIVLVTVPDLKTGRRLAQAALEARLAACANLVPGVESHYWWRGKIERGSELLLLLKTTVARVKALERMVLREHPYDTAEFVALPVGTVSRRYLAWWRGSLQRKAGPVTRV